MAVKKKATKKEVITKEKEVITRKAYSIGRSGKGYWALYTYTIDVDTNQVVDTDSGYETTRFDAINLFKMAVARAFITRDSGELK